jgi:hypothetical protein
MLPESFVKIHRAPESIRVAVRGAFHKMKHNSQRRENGAARQTFCWKFARLLCTRGM